MTEQPDTKDLILTAAMERILHYGYSKTTMAEIARDCDMSAGNIYRFFDSKLDIAEALARRKTAKNQQTLSEIASRKGEPALDRLEEFYLFRMTYSYDLLTENPKLIELVDVMARERPEFGKDLLGKERVFVSDILKQGMARGEVRQLENVDLLARTLQTALIKFEYPPLWLPFTFEELESELKNVLKLFQYALNSGVECDQGKVR
ncbi:MAG: TetR family transcriptional regulator [Ponticaulis sp.]|nr:TetR family transcriptional regulator [Ponticaulis sp.]